MIFAIECGRISTVWGWKYGPSLIDVPQKHSIIKSETSLIEFLNRLPKEVMKAHKTLAIIAPKQYHHPEMKVWVQTWSSHEKMSITEVLVITPETALREAWVALDRRQRQNCHAWLLLIDYYKVTLVQVHHGKILEDRKWVLNEEGIEEIFRRLMMEEHVRDPLSNPNALYVASHLIHRLCLLVQNDWPPVPDDEDDFAYEVGRLFKDKGPLYAKDLIEKIEQMVPHFALTSYPLLMGGAGGGLLAKFISELRSGTIWPEESTPFTIVDGAQRYGERIFKTRPSTQYKRGSRIYITTKNQRILDAINSKNRREKNRFIENAILCFLDSQKEKSGNSN